MREIVQRENLAPSDVRRVRVTMGPAQVSMLRNRRPRTALEAKFSAEFAVAAPLVARRAGLAELTDEFVLREDVQRTFEKVEVGVDERPCPIDPAFGYADRVVIETVGGRVFDSGEIRFPLGNAMRPLGAADLRQKFLDCVAAGTDGVAPDGAALYERLARLDALPTLRTLFAG